jgi:hypothetical protein
MRTSIIAALHALLIYSNAFSQTEAGRKEKQSTFDQAAALEALRKQIAGSESKPAEDVFKNIQSMKGIPAGRLLRVMEMGYAKSLGVSCEHCHVPNTWESDDVPTKQIAREMSQLVRTISSDLLPKIKNLKNEKPIVNCTT